MFDSELPFSVDCVCMCVCWCVSVWLVCFGGQKHISGQFGNAVAVGWMVFVDLSLFRPVFLPGTSIAAFTHCLVEMRARDSARRHGAYQDNVYPTTKRHLM